jgi:hypothetical protein
MALEHALDNLQLLSWLAFMLAACLGIPFWMWQRLDRKRPRRHVAAKASVVVVTGVFLFVLIVRWMLNEIAESLNALFM